jgi:hypothetical protein
MASPEQQMTPSRPRRHPAHVLLAALVAALAALVWPAGAVGSTDTVAWYHALDVIAGVNAAPPEVPLVVLLGGSVAKECTVGDTDWAAQVRRRGGPEVVARNISSPFRTFYEDVALVKGLPQVPTIVFIGVNLGRFTQPYQSAEISLTPDPARSAGYTQHGMGSQILSLEKKRVLVLRWLTNIYPYFKSRHAYDLRRLELLVSVCKRRGLHPVIVEMPRNLAVIGSAFDVPVRQYHSGCYAIARKYGIPFVNFLRAAALVNRDFRDLGHLVDSGRTRYQRLLSDKTIALLKAYGMTPPIYETSSAARMPDYRPRRST